MKKYKICLIKGDGIGPEIIDEAVKVLDAIASCEEFDFVYEEALMGGCAYDITGDPLPNETISTAMNSDAVLFGAIGGEKWDKLERHLRPESGLLGLRKEMGTFANLRPATVYDELNKHLEGKMGTMAGAPDQYQLEDAVFDGFDSGDDVKYQAYFDGTGQGEVCALPYRRLYG